MKKIFRKPTEKERQQMRSDSIVIGIFMIICGLLLMYDGPIRAPYETIKTANGFLEPCYSVYRPRRGFDLYVVVNGEEYFLNDDYVERPIGELERELNRMVTYGAEVTYIEGPNLKPHLLGLKVLGDEIVSFDEVYGNWQKNDRILTGIGIACLVLSPVMFVLAKRIKKKTDSE